MLGYDGFTILIAVSILAPVIGAITLLAMLVFERETDLLRSRNSELVLEKELHRMEYIQLSQQIEPHFFFNTLNLLLSLARLKKSAELIESIEHLALFLRFSYQSKGGLSKLDEEINFTQHYLGIQKFRYGQRLKVILECPEDLREALILPYLLQTLVENAFKHGLEKKVGEAELRIRFSSTSDIIRLEIEDNGPEKPLPEDVPLRPDMTGGGQGLSNIRRRLALIFGENANLTFRSVGDITLVTVCWPQVYDDEFGVGL